MSKWRPVEQNAIFTIGDIHGNVNLLNKILKRILPLRKSDGAIDCLVLLGDYIDRHVDSHLVLDKLIVLKSQYPDQVILLKGNHESMLLKALNMVPGRNISLQDGVANYQMWLRNGGFETVIGYMRRAGMEVNENDMFTMDRMRLSSLIPMEHIKFLQQELVNYWIYENWNFVHGGCDPMEDLNKQESEALLWDRNLMGYVLKCINQQEQVPWEQIIVTGHNGTTNRPVVHPNFLMLDCCSPKQLLVVELRSMMGMMAYPKKDRLVQFPLTLTAPTVAPEVRKANTFRRIQ